jgi:PAS domain S-box-containing protein
MQKDFCSNRSAQPLVLTFFIFYSLLLSNSNPSVAQTFSDSEIRAAYVFQFAQNIYWPNEEKIDSFSIIVYGTNLSMYSIFYELASTRTLKGKPISVKHFYSLLDIHQPYPNIFYLESENTHEHQQVYNKFINTNTLVITDDSKQHPLVMINFRYDDSKKRKINFEINSSVIEQQQKLSVQPRLLLLGGTVIDLTDLFHKKEVELQDERTRASQYQLELERQKDLIANQNAAIDSQKVQISLQIEQIEEQKLKIENQQSNLDNLLVEIAQQQKILSDKMASLGEQENAIADQKNIIDEQSKVINRRNSILDRQRKEVDEMQKRIEDQRQVLIKQSKQIQTQQGLLSIFTITILLAIGMIFFIYKSFQNKKRANRILEEKNAAIEIKNKEIDQQREEMRSQAELLANTNKELEKLSIVASETDNSIVIMDAKGNIEWMNPAYTRITGFTMEELFKEIGSTLVEVSSHPGIEDLYKLCIEKKETITYETSFVQKNDEVIWLQTTLTPILNSNGEIVKMVAIDSNITEMKNAHEETIAMIDEIVSQAELIQNQNDEILRQRDHIEKTQKQLMQSEKMASIGVLTAGIAHEINNPINFVYAGVNSMMRDFSDLDQVLKEIQGIDNMDVDPVEVLSRIKSKMEEYDFKEAHNAVMQTLNDIRIGAQRTAEIVEGLRNFSRAENEVWGEVNIHRVLDGVLVLLKNTYKNRIEIAKNYNESLPELECKPGKINQIFMNIISNAIDAIENQGIITISTSIMDDEMIVSIKDTGQGMSEEVQSKIFDPFFTTKEVGKGVGLGLAITYAIIEEHQGRLNVNSKVGEGTDFSVIIPLKRKKPQ